MDKALLVDAGHQLMTLLEQDGIPVRAAVWMYSADTNTWKLWIVPHTSITEKRDFYRRVATIISKNRTVLQGLDASDVEMIESNHPAMRALRSLFHVTKKSSVHLSNNLIGGVYLQDAIILLMNL
jgi:hypothetical protein